jgi:hypothetical protein
MILFPRRNLIALAIFSENGQRKFQKKRIEPEPAVADSHRFFVAIEGIPPGAGEIRRAGCCVTS